MPFFGLLKSEARKQRAADKALLENEPQLRAESDRLRAEIAAVREKVQRGELTRAALDPLELRESQLGRRIAELANTVRSRLVDSCPDEALRQQRRELNAEKLRIGERRGKVGAELERLGHERKVWQDNHAGLDGSPAKYILNPLTGAGSVVNPKWEREREMAQSRLAGIEQRVAELEAERDELPDRLAELKAELAANREAMIAA